ncbi:hypothetical protein IJG72_05805 [bacterium]|nr:hypothetical protein [bacterium]
MKVVAFTGAGISKSAGIPTFEDTPGVKEKFSVEYREAHPIEYQKAKLERVKMFEGKEPTKAHKALADLQIPIITMNIDGLHRKAGSKLVYEIHGSYIADNVVLYGEDIHFREKSINLIIQTAQKAKWTNEDAILLVIGTSMQTVFAHIIVWVAEKYGMKVKYINENADEEVPKFLKENVFLPKN